MEQTANNNNQAQSDNHLDEITNAPMAVQAASYRLILDREVGQYKLHDKVFIASAGS